MQNLLYATAVACLTATLAAAAPAGAPKGQQPSENKAAKAVTLSREIIEQVRRAASMIVYLDPVTGEMRAPTPQERAALLDQHTAGTTTQSVPARPVQLSDGGLAIQADPSQFDFAVATQGPDGKVRYHCTKPGVAKVSTNAKAEGGDDQ